MAMIYYIIRIARMYGGSGEYDTISRNIDELENRINKHEEKMSDVKDEIDANTPEIESMERKILDIRSEIRQLEEKLEHPFVRQAPDQG
jgi:predicted  nucleic acid-binding Zn-ribbon protein